MILVAQCVSTLLQFICAEHFSQRTLQEDQVALVLMVFEPLPTCVMCWNGPSCKWLSLGSCRFGHHGMEAVKVRQAGDGGESGLDAHVREVCDALVKLAANVVWRSGVPLAVQVARGTTASDSKEVVEPTVEVVEEIDRMVVLPEIGDAGVAGEADRTEVLSVDGHPGGIGETDGANELVEIEDDGGETDWMNVPSRSWRLVAVLARLVGWMRCRRSGRRWCDRSDGRVVGRVIDGPGRW